MRAKLILLILSVIGFIFLPTAVFLVFGMLPTFAAMAVDRSIGKNKTICVCAMNFAGCFPFLLKFWTNSAEQTVERALQLVGSVETILVIYILAAGGYAIDKAVTGITSSVIIQRAETRIKKIKIEQEKLIKRWGEKVTGQYKLDDYGFPIDPIPSRTRQNDDDNDTTDIKGDK